MIVEVYLCDVLHAEIHIRHAMLDVCRLFLPEERSRPISHPKPPRQSHSPHTDVLKSSSFFLKLTVKSLINVDFPAPFGPMMPTRLLRLSAHVTSIRLGSFRPGYVNVHLLSFRIARVLERTPMSEPGGGKENRTVVAARV